MPLASMWRVPKLQRFFQRYPDIDVRTVASNETLDLERERLDLAIRWIAPGAVEAGAEHLFDVEIFPVCSPTLERERARPLNTPSDLSHHVILYFETVTGRGRWSDWQQWLAGLKLDDLKSAGRCAFRILIRSCKLLINGNGIAMGRSPHNAGHLREGLLVAPFGPQQILGFGCYVAVISERSNERRVVRKFLSWLRYEVGEDRKATAEAPKRKRGSA